MSKQIIFPRVKQTGYLYIFLFLVNYLRCTIVYILDNISNDQLQTMYDSPKYPKIINVIYVVIYNTNL